MPPFCSQPIHPAAQRGIVLIEEGAYFEAHEALEIAWRETPPPGRELYQGILQAAVTYLHLQRGNWEGARKVYQRAFGHLQPWMPRCQGINLETLLGHLAQVLHPQASAAPVAFAPPQGLLIPSAHRYRCDCCGHEMIERNCKILCPNCGYRFDCSDLTLFLG
ncbi:MAG: DUF309 domain-containing protein [Anaerolineales bacterium]